MSTNTQSFLPVEDIRDDVVVMKDGSMAIILQTSAVNFDLLSETEQLAIIGAFAGLLNSLSFSIQIVIRSKRLDISSYLKVLRAAETEQKNPLLQIMMQHYRQFVANIIQNNEVLDKQFYVVLSVSYLELGVVKDVDKNFEKGLTLLSPRRDHILRQLTRIGLKTNQLTTDKLIALFYDYYNDDSKPNPKDTQDQKAKAPAQPTVSQLAQNPIIPPKPINPQTVPPTAPLAKVPTVQVQPAPAANQNPTIRPLSRNVPFAVEELPDDFGRTA